MLRPRNKLQIHRGKPKLAKRYSPETRPKVVHPYELFHPWTPVEAAGRRAPEGLVRGRKDTWLSF